MRRDAPIGRLFFTSGVYHSMDQMSCLISKGFSDQTALTQRKFVDGNALMTVLLRLCVVSISSITAYIKLKFFTKNGLA